MRRLEAGRRQPGAWMRAGLEQLAHLVGSDQAGELAADHLGAVRARRGQGRGARARCPAGARNRAWVRMRGLARRRPAPRRATAGKSAWTVRSASPGLARGSTFCVAAQRLQGVAGAGRVAAVVDRAGPPPPSRGDQGRRARRRGPPGPADCSTAPGRAAPGSRARGRRAARPKASSPARVQPDHRSAQPPAVRTNWRAGRQSRNSLAMQDHRRARRGGRPGSSAQRRRPAAPARRPERRAAARWSPPARPRRRPGSAGAGARRAGRRSSGSRRRGPISTSRSRRGRPSRAQAAAAHRPISSPNIWRPWGAVMKSPSAPSAGRVA